MKSRSPGQLILVDRPLRRTMLITAPKAHYFDIELATGRVRVAAATGHGTARFTRYE